MGKPRTPSAWTMMGFGVIALVIGALGLIRPELELRMLGFPVLDDAQRSDGDFTSVFLAASSMASFNMGVYYILSSLANWKAFFRWTVPFRFLTCVVFTTLVVTGVSPSGLLGIGLWEGVGAVVTGVALGYERRKSRSA